MQQIRRRSVVLFAALATAAALSFPGQALAGPALAAAGPPTGTSAQDGRIAFVRGNQIWTVHPDGTALRQLTKRGNNSHPVWSPDGQRIAFLHQVGGASDLWVMGDTGQHAQQVTTDHVATGASWSPDGSQLVLGSPLRTVSSRAPFGSPVTMTASTFEGGDRSTFDVSGTSAPVWSPDGRWIAFVSTSFPDSPDLYLLVLDRTTSIVYEWDAINGACCGFGLFADPAWSPDSRTLSYTVSRAAFRPHSASTVIATTFPNRDNTLFTGTPHDRQAVFAPSGRRIALVNDQGGVARIYLAAGDGTARRFLVFGAQPSWQPHPQRSLVPSTRG